LRTVLAAFACACSSSLLRTASACYAAAMPAMKPKSVLITGTTSGVGQALLDHYVTHGVAVIAVNRRRVTELESRYPGVRHECVDVRSPGDVAGLVSRLAATGQLPEVFILNAGINRLDNDESFELAPYQEVMATNLYGVVSFVAPLTQLPATPACRHIIAISSLAAYAGNPCALGYSTSKKAVTACFETWARMYAGTDLVFQQLMLGPVPTAIYTMGDRLPTWIVRIRSFFSGSLDGTVRAVARLAQSRKRKLVYPWRALPLFLASRLAQWLVPGLLPGRKTLAGKKRRPARTDGP